MQANTFRHSDPSSSEKTKGSTFMLTSPITPKMVAYEDIQQKFLGSSPHPLAAAATILKSSYSMPLVTCSAYIYETRKCSQTLPKRLPSTGIHSTSITREDSHIEYSHHATSFHLSILQHLRACPDIHATRRLTEYYHMLQPQQCARYQVHRLFTRGSTYISPRNMATSYFH